ncbi:uncharacterized protein si:ch211-149e23.4 isoform X2 [Cololabis saira]|uniref:uncharacterized protein si:ch211-149e23.4 isoform X2 n=1 Tax=Cololabis saira TaxID=129043 RepID=UPI002AD36DC4|nr:uncharacterized protein si:ch211-149e23.4 isoform X2 [Cololabis saira]
MGCSWLLLLGLVLNVSHCLEIEGSGAEQTFVISHNATALLGEDVYLSCRYQGDSQIHSGKWKRQTNSKSKLKRLAGFLNGKPFSNDDFSDPDSPTNLTVRMKVSSVEAEGEYICEFESEEEYFYESVFVTVLARPDIQVQVKEETISDTSYQSVSCSAVGGRPTAQISWLVGGLPPSDPPFTVNLSETPHSNGTSSLSSVLRFPTHLQDSDTVTCAVQHPTLPNPELTTVRVETYAKPNVTIKAEMVQQGGNDFWVVSCISSGGRPGTDVSLALNMTEELRRENDTNGDAQRLSVHLPATEYEGQSVTCVFKHPKFTHAESRGLTLPAFYLTTGRLQSEVGNGSDEFFELQEGETDIVIDLEVRGNVPRYNASCKKDDKPLPDGVELLGRNFTVRGPVEHQHAGLYQCDFSYHHLKATLRLNVTVKPQDLRPVPPTIGVELRSEDGRVVLECAAADAVPAASVTWLLPVGLSDDLWFSSTSYNGSHSVRGVLNLPACSPWELTAQCVINHPAFEEPENRSITLPLCARPNITVGASVAWRDGHKYTKLQCSAISVASAATISWHTENNDTISHMMETEVQAEGLVLTRSSVDLLSSAYAGQNLTCLVQHPSLDTPEIRTMNIPEQQPLQLSVSVVRQQDSSLWLAACDFSGEGVGENLTWVLPENAGGETSLRTEYVGHVMKVRLTYEFPLASHEGQDLTCVYRSEDGITERRTVHIPTYYISSLRILNHTTPLQSRYGDQLVMHRVAVQENRHNQKILLRVEGNVPEYSLDCRRSDGSIVPMDGAAMILQTDVSGQDNRQYICSASFYHHRATVNIQVEVMRQDEFLIMVAMICISSASAILLILAVALFFCCKRNNKKQYKEQESLSALTSLMLDPGSPEVKKPAATAGDKEYAQLTRYSIVIDIKSTV